MKKESLSDVAMSAYDGLGTLAQFHAQISRGKEWTFRETTVQFDDYNPSWVTLMKEALALAWGCQVAAIKTVWLKS